MRVHKLLNRQLERLTLNYETMPDTLEKWQGLLNFVSKTYVEADQERYLLERSMDISSRELIDINRQLEDAQLLAALCYWRYNSRNHLITWSKNLYQLLHIDLLDSLPTYNEFIMRIHQEDRPLFKKNMAKGENSDFKIRLKTKDDSYTCFRFIIHSEGKTQLSGIIMDINATEDSEFRINELNKALLATARLAGMSEVATIILHNIGNLLNSMNVSLATLKDTLDYEHHEKLAQLIKMLPVSASGLHEFFLNNPKGKLIMPYLATISEMMRKENETNSEEVAHIEKNLNHIKEIVAMQQTISGVAGISERIRITELVENALEMANLNEKDLIITKKIDKNINILANKTKLLQILTNILGNAKQAVEVNEHTKPKKVTILVNQENDQLKIRIKDNGIGVSSENLNRIFSFGFTTKPEGHGFGLHSSALSAKELGGSLTVHSLGAGRGAEFTLVLPCTGTKERIND